jgi:hypothetical protein
MRCGGPGRRGPRAASGPAASDLVVLAEASFVAKPDFDVGGIEALLAGDVCQRLRELVLNASMAPSA